MPDPGTVWLDDIDNDLVAALETAVAADVNAAIQATNVYPGPAPHGALPPFVNVWPIGPTITGAGLAGESSGRAIMRWQITIHGATTGQTRYLLEILTAGSVWPQRWAIDPDEFGPIAADRSDEPATWMAPFVVYRY